MEPKGNFCKDHSNTTLVKVKFPEAQNLKQNILFKYNTC